MQNSSIYFTVRVAVIPLLVAAGLAASPGSASGGRADGIPVEVGAPASAADGGPAFDATAWDDEALGAISRDVFALALESAASAVARGEAEPETLTVIDFSQPSTTKRMWVYDLDTRELLFEEHVAHGRNSGHNLPTQFSNTPESNMSSLGLFRAAEGYVGKHGYSLRLDGLEPGVNDLARARAIVIHGAEYVNAKVALAQGRLGRSLGCPAVRPEISRSLINAIKDGGLVFAYYPDPAWLKTSTFLN